MRSAAIGCTLIGEDADVALGLPELERRDGARRARLRVTLRLSRERKQDEDLDQRSRPSCRGRRRFESLEQADGVRQGLRVIVVGMASDQDARERDVLVLAQVRQLVVGREPLRSRTQASAWSSSPRRSRSLARVAGTGRTFGE